MNYASIGIQGIGYSIPDRIVTNKDIENLIGLEEEQVAFYTGVKERRWANENEAFSDFAIKAGQAAIEDSGVSKEEINLLIVATGSGDFFSPATGSLIQHELGLENALVLNLNQACAASNYALATAIRYMIDGTYDKALVVTGDCTSRMLNAEENLFMGFIGDGASAVVLGKLKAGFSGFLSEHFDSDGKFFYGSGLFNRGSRVPRAEQGEGKDYFITRSEIVGVLLPRVITWFTTSLDECLRKANLKRTDVNFYSPHPAAISQLEAQLDAIGESLEKTHIVTDMYGHSGAGSAFIILKEAVQNNKIKPGDYIFQFGNAAGFQWAGMLLRWCDKNEFI
ncbi:3-oxoacyl-ACP synthase III family protein [Fusibacter sp. 3D3]|uniref:3-oxoacyl-ACP synthase III family protein n=1 Tax=Fusibacter sp. 3D3 TaxID=1048380 RepID=UPI0008532E0A|nr:3-oxoacyl-ACP synthase III family protein [Fusibacter sp. 3D3]GAU79285.1 3-oxoacyl-[acyl-carrier-protein] synthase KASIII [Fusibacter sp. 3D3]